MRGGIQTNFHVWSKLGRVFQYETTQDNHEVDNFSLDFLTCHKQIIKKCTKKRVEKYSKTGIYFLWMSVCVNIPKYLKLLRRKRIVY